MTNSKEKSKVSEWNFDKNRQEYAVDALVMSVQFALQRVMSESCVNQKELAERLGVSAARISQYLAKDASNMTIKTIAKIADALGEEFELLSMKEIRNMKSKKKQVDPTISQPSNVVRIHHRQTRNSWIDESAANDRLDANEAVAMLAYAVGQ